MFSQFVDHLAIIREGWTARASRINISMAARRRGSANGVDAFQAGEGDVFLISLKAGGLGLNLTAAGRTPPRGKIAGRGQRASGSPIYLSHVTHAEKQPIPTLPGRYVG